ncbi:MAG: hypothetical protein AUG04_00980 [Deltaproteobacteria bacterium 13_1_20CM_2_69_21]|nr:MAG: hypothetical protein AUH83_05410 [Deltaproteobacteria bacterium 13_1_40CM_4_68_19]OLE64328.1 MAG: hypothetical protein AUG04_00980 [Deltaproteobacteria bacterium 13_1_20CM_2_69_21]
MVHVLAVALSLDAGAASHFARLALRCARQEYPNKLDHVMNGAQEVLSPRALHPAFYGCFDWHSTVHGHWMLARLLRQFPQLPEAAEIRALLDEHLAPEAVAVEVAYFGQPNRKSFERTYGWAWLLKLEAELRAWDSPEARRWAEALQPLADTVTRAFLDFLPRQTYPIRTGVHPNTAFGLSLALDYAQAVHDGKLGALVAERARTYFAKDTEAPLKWEPGGEDFLSPSLEEAALMARVLSPHEFRAWVKAFLPVARLTPAIVSDRTDPKIVHLDGLNLSRARCLYALSAALRRPALARLGDTHAQASLPFIASGSYEGEHWLGTFAVQMLDAREQGAQHSR